MKGARTFLDALMWAAGGAAIAALLFLIHYLTVHNSTTEIDEHISSEVRS